jgi:plasmid maintenance system antidote protein VapI
MNEISEKMLAVAFNELVERHKKTGTKKKEMADWLNITAPHLSNILKGNKEAQFSQVATLAGKLGLSFTTDFKGKKITFDSSNFL